MSNGAYEKERAMLNSSIGRILASSILASLWLTSSAIAANVAQTALTAGHGVLCDTQEELASFVSNNKDDAVARLTAVNDKFGKESCSVLSALFYKGDEVSKVLVPEGIVHVFKVQIVEYRVGDEWMHLSKPMDQYVGVLERATTV
jgi:hypothetical protein